MEVRLRLSLLKVEQADPIKASVDLLYSPPVFRGLNVWWCCATEIKQNDISANIKTNTMMGLACR